MADTTHHRPPPVVPKPGTVDPVCGMTVDPERAQHRYEHAGTTYLFCSASCQERFAADPNRFLEGERGRHSTPAAETHPEERAGSGGLYTCPMHPEIVRDGPGSCPICGMALEPRTVTLDDEANPELAQMSRRFGVGAALAAPVVAIAMLEHAPGGWLAGIAPQGVWTVVQLALTTPVVLWCGWPLLERGWRLALHLPMVVHQRRRG